MSPTLRNTLPYTLALAVIAFVLFYLVSSMSTALTFIAGVLACGILVPILVDVKKPTAQSKAVNNPVSTEGFQGDTATLYVGNLPYRANEDAVKELFGRFGTVINVRLMKDRQTGRRRGFGFVEVAATDANNMIGKLNDFEFQERTLKVREARDRQDDETQAAE
ncbi:RNA recognition motif domain-containing protein [Alishewanella sp. HL-SH05]|uniref:RNA recognition motif domain-containing protein n=1 Tax=Alishewanella sp. HL-SH05 TaxID=3461145 RepID=UPI0040411108